MFRDGDVICNREGLAGTLNPLEVWIHFLSLSQGQGSRDKGIEYEFGTVERVGYGAGQRRSHGMKSSGHCLCLLLSPLANQLPSPSMACSWDLLCGLGCPGLQCPRPSLSGCQPGAQYRLPARCSGQAEMNSSQSQN